MKPRAKTSPGDLERAKHMCSKKQQKWSEISEGNKRKRQAEENKKSASPLFIPCPQSILGFLILSLVLCGRNPKLKVRRSMVYWELSCIADKIYPHVNDSMQHHIFNCFFSSCWGSRAALFTLSNIFSLLLGKKQAPILAMLPKLPNAHHTHAKESGAG